MSEDSKKEIAVFRFGVIHDLLGQRKLKKGEKERIIKEKTEQEWNIPYSGRSYICRSTILNWVKIYKNSGEKLESLYPKERSDKGISRNIDEELIVSLANLKKELDEKCNKEKRRVEKITLPVLLLEAEKRGMIIPSKDTSRATIYRAMKKIWEDDRNSTDRRRFEAELPNDIWQVDVLHGPYVQSEGKLRKSYLILFLDDMSRLIIHGEFYLGEGLNYFEVALKEALLKRGLPRKIYLDNAPAFRSHQLKYITASLGISLINSRAGVPQGRGKVERIFKTVRMQFLSTIPDGLSLMELNTKFKDWVDNDYHIREHSVTRQKPLKRYLKHIYAIREAPKDLTEYFRKRVIRKVKKDRTVSLNGISYECPIELVQRSIKLLYHEEDMSRVEAFYKDKSYGMLIVLDPVINSKVKRQNNENTIKPKQLEITEDKEQVYKTGKLFIKEKNNDQL